MLFKQVSYHGLTFICVLFSFYFSQVFTLSSVNDAEALVASTSTIMSLDTVMPDSIVFSDCLLDVDSIIKNSTYPFSGLFNFLDDSTFTSGEAIEEAGYCMGEISLPPDFCPDTHAGALDLKLENLQKVFGYELLQGPIKNIHAEILIYAEDYRGFPTGIKEWRIAGYSMVGSLAVGIFPFKFHALLITAEDTLGREKNAIQFFQVIDDSPPIANCPNQLDVFLYPDTSANAIEVSGLLDSYDIIKLMDGTCRTDYPEIRRLLLDTASLNDWETEYGRPLLDEYPTDHPDYGKSFTAWNREVDYYLSDLGKTLDLELRLTDRQGNTSTCTTQVNVKKGANLYLPLGFNDCVLSNDTFPDMSSEGAIPQIIHVLNQTELNTVEKIEATGACVKEISTRIMDCTGILDTDFEALLEVFGADFICGGPGLEFELEPLHFGEVPGFAFPNPAWQIGGYPKLQDLFVGIPARSLQAIVITARDSSGQFVTGLQFFKVIDQTPPFMKCLDEVELFIQNKFDDDDQDGLAHLTTAIIDDGSWDNCGPVELKLKIAELADSTISWRDTLSYSCANIGEILNITLQATDESSNTNTCTSTVKILAEEIPGSPLDAACQERPSVQLIEDANNNYSATINATAFISLTACTTSPYPADVFSLYLDDALQGPLDNSTPKQASIQLNCNHLDGWSTRLIPVRLTFADTSGVLEQCKTYISLSRENNNCAPVQPTLKGSIRDFRHQAIADIEVRLSGALDTLLSTDDTGIFKSSLINQLDDEVNIQAFKDDDHNQGISTLDLIRIARHILGRETIESPYLLIAADINSSKSITTFDLIQLRKLILGITNSFSNNRSWRFIPADFQFQNPKAPWKNFPEEISVTPMQANQRLDFIGIKIGDIVNATEMGLRTSNRNITMQLKDEMLYPGKKHAFTLAIPEVEISGIQFSIDFNNAFVDHINYKQIPAEHVFWNKERNQLSVASNGLVKGDLLTLEIKVSKPQPLSEVLKINERQLKAEVYTTDLNVRPLQFQFLNKPDQAAFEVYQNIPNPVLNETRIPFFIPGKGEVQLRLFDTNGKEVLKRVQVFPEGKHFFDLRFETEMPAGVYFYAIHFKNQIVRKRLIIS